MLMKFLINMVVIIFVNLVESFWVRKDIDGYNVISKVSGYVCFFVRFFEINKLLNESEDGSVKKKCLECMKFIILFLCLRKVI